MTAEAPKRLVLDTQVALDLLHFADPRTRTLKDVLDSRRALVVSDEACRSEWRRVLHYPALRLDPAQRARLEADFDALVTMLVHEPGSALPQPPLPRCADPDDQKFLELALAAGASALLTRDAAVLALARRCARQGRFAILAPESFDPEAW